MYKLKINNEVSLGEIDHDDETVAEAIYSTYSDYTYDVSLIWNNFVIPLDRRGDISEMYNDIILMLNTLKEMRVSFLDHFFPLRSQLSGISMLKLTI